MVPSQAVLFEPEPVPEPAERPALRDVALADLPATYHPLLERFDRVDPGCARVCRIAVADGEASGRPYGTEFLATLVDRAERKAAAAIGAGQPVEPKPYGEPQLRALVESSFRSVSGLWEAVTDHDPGAVTTALDLIARLRARLAGWGLHTGDVRAGTAGPDGERPPHEYAQAQTTLAALVCRLAKGLADREAGRYPDDTPRRLDRDLRGFADAVEGARRLLDGGPLHLPTELVETVGDRRTWWAVVAGPGKAKRKRFSLKRGARPVTWAQRPGVLGPFATERQAREAAQRATCRPEDAHVGLFAPAPTDAPPPNDTLRVRP